MRILIVEDDQDDIEFYEEAIKHIVKEALIVKASDGDRGLALLNAGHFVPELIILDYNLPVMNGMTFLTLVRGDTKLRHLFVTVLSTVCNDLDTKAFKALGAECFVKPSSFEKLRETLEEIIRVARRKLDGLHGASDFL